VIQQCDMCLQFIILVIDSTDRERLGISKEELYRMLACEVLIQFIDHFPVQPVLAPPVFFHYLFHRQPFGISEFYGYGDSGTGFLDQMPWLSPSHVKALIGRK